MEQLNCGDFIQSYIDYILNGFSVVSSSNSSCHLITPYWRPDGNHIEIIIQSKDDGTIILSDEGQTSDWLFSIGLDLDTSDTRQKILHRLIKRYGVTHTDEAFRLLITDSELIGEEINNFLAFLHSISYLTLTRQQRGTSTFKEQVALFLTENQQVFTSEYSVQGKTVEHKIDFHVNSTQNMLLEALTAKSTSSGKDLSVATSFKWLDIAGAGWNYEKVVLLDDTEDQWERIWNNERILRPLEAYSDRIIRWSQRATLIKIR